MFSKGITLSLLTMLSRILGLLREMTKAHFLGTSKIADAFAIAFLIPNLLRRLFAENSISVAFIPTFRYYLQDITNDKANTVCHDFVNATFTLITFCTTVVVAIGVVLSPVIVTFFLDNNDSELLLETTLLTRIMFPYLLLISIAAFFQGLLNGVKIFNPSGFTPVLFNAIVIICTWILSPYMKNPARAMSIGVVLGGSIQALFQLPFVLKTKWTPCITTLARSLKNPGTKKVLLLIAPTILGMAAYQLNDLVSTALAGKAGTGVVSSLQYSLRLQELVLGVFAVSVGTIILPDMAEYAKHKRWQDFADMLSTALKTIVLVCLPTTVFFLLCGKEVIVLLFRSHSFDNDSVALTLSAFRFHISGLVFIAIVRVLSPAYYACSDSKTPALCGIASFAVNIALALLLARRFQGSGIAFSLSASSVCNMLLLFIFLCRVAPVGTSALCKKLLAYFVKIALLCAIDFLPTFLLKNTLCSTITSVSRLQLALCIVLPCFLCFTTVGIVLLLLTKDSMIEILLSKIRQKSK